MGNLQLEYAALDAVVLVHLFHHIGSHSQPTDALDGSVRMDWKSHIVSAQPKPNGSPFKALDWNVELGFKSGCKVGMAFLFILYIPKP